MRWYWVWCRDASALKNSTLFLLRCQRHFYSLFAKSQTRTEKEESLGQREISPSGSLMYLVFVLIAYGGAYTAAPLCLVRPF